MSIIDIIKGLVIIILIAGVYYFGNLVMKKVDSFLDENMIPNEGEDNRREPSRVMLTDQMTTEEITDEIEKFISKHEKTTILLYGNEDEKIS